MWAAISDVLNGANATVILGFILILIVIITLLIKRGYIKVCTKAIRIGDSSEQERTIVQQQIDQARLYITALEGKVTQLKPEQTYGGFFTKWILEQVFDEVVQWITFNHISDSSAYIHVKQMKMCSLVYSLNPDNIFKTPEFKKRMDNWVAELIAMLIDIRKIYSKKEATND